MQEHSHKLLYYIGISIVAFLTVVGVFSLGVVSGMKIQEKRAIFSAHQDFLPFPPDFLGKMDGKKLPTDRDHRFALNGTIQSVSSGTLMMMDGATLRQVTLTPMTRVRDGKDTKEVGTLRPGQRVNVLGHENPEQEFEAVMVMVKK